MDYSKELNEFYLKNHVYFYNDDELWNMNEKLHILFLELKRLTNNNDKVKELYDRVFEYIDVSNKKNFKKAFEMGLYINKNSDGV